MRLFVAITFLLTAIPVAAAGPEIVWPEAPDTAKVAYVGEIRCADLKKSAGVLGKVKRLIAGGEAGEDLSLPFDVEAAGEFLYMTCRSLPGLVRVNLDKQTYELFESKELPLASPVAVAASGDEIFVSDSERGVVYRLQDGSLKPWITAGLNRPTGLAVGVGGDRLYVVDTGDHQVKVFDLAGNRQGAFGERSEGDSGLNFPTFITASPDGGVLVNDSLNYRIKHFDASGRLIGSFGEEGDGPGTFARPKGIAFDGHRQVYVVDNLFDNIQVFDGSGQLLLVVGTGGEEPGQFWSPGGIDIQDNVIYVADTYNHRIQILRFLGDG